MRWYSGKQWIKLPKLGRWWVHEFSACLSDCALTGVQTSVTCNMRPAKIKEDCLFNFNTAFCSVEVFLIQLGFIVWTVFCVGMSVWYRHAQNYAAFSLQWEAPCLQHNNRRMMGYGWGLGGGPCGERRAHPIESRGQLRTRDWQGSWPIGTEQAPARAPHLHINRCPSSCSPLSLTSTP